MDKFCELMEKVRSCDVDMPTYITPSNYEKAKEEFLANPELRVPNFEYYRYGLSEKQGVLDDLIASDSDLEMLSFVFGDRKDLHESFQFVLRGYKDGIFSGTELSPAQLNMLFRYAISVDSKLKTLELMQNYRDLKKEHVLCSDERLINLRARISFYNEFLNDIPDESVYNQLLNGALMQGSFVPHSQTVERFRELLEQKWKKSLSRIDSEKKEYSSEEVCDLANIILREDFEFETDFCAKVVPKRQIMGINQLEHIFEIPAKRANGKFTPKNLRNKVLGHELFGHVYRAAYICPKHPELAITLPCYEVFEEGVTKCIEQALGKGYEISGMESYLLCGMAYCDQLDFRGVFERYLSHRKKQKPDKEITQKTIDTIFSRTNRAFRGTGDIPWTASTVYFNGPHKVWPFIEKLLDQPEKLWHLMFESGKTDPTLTAHQELLKCYGYTDEDFRF